MERTGLDQLYRDGDHWHDHHLGELWLAAARELAPNHPADAQRACQWSHHYFELYNKAWTAHLPASRWDSDGGAEMMEVQEFDGALVTDGAGSPVPDWVAGMLEGDWRKALAALGGGASGPEKEPSDPKLSPVGQREPGLNRANVSARARIWRASSRELPVTAT